ncbi:MAG: hypothetical protein QW794_03230 [Thermosphaera sp.]
MKKTVYIVPNDSGLRKALSELGVVIYTVRLVNGKEIDVCDTVYEEVEDAKILLEKYCEKATIEIEEPRHDV